MWVAFVFLKKKTEMAFVCRMEFWFCRTSCVLKWRHTVLRGCTHQRTGKRCKDISRLGGSKVQPGLSLVGDGTSQHTTSSFTYQYRGKNWIIVPIDFRLSQKHFINMCILTRTNTYMHQQSHCVGLRNSLLHYSNEFRKTI